MQEHRMRESSLRVQPLIGLQREIRNAPLLEKLRRHSLGGRFISNMLGAVFTKLEI
jgi:hypothetical protein